MKTLRLQLAVLAVISTAFASKAYADPTYSGVTITQIEQQYNDRMYVYVTPAPTTTGCTNQQPFIIVEPNALNSGYPGMKVAAPSLMAAFLYNKTINVTVGCSGGFPNIETLWVNQ